MEDCGMNTGQHTSLTAIHKPLARRNARRKSGQEHLADVAALVVLLLLAVGFFEGRKAYWDYQVRGMCEKDGGARIHEHELITHQEALANHLLIGGEIVILRDQSGRQAVATTLTMNPFTYEQRHQVYSVLEPHWCVCEI
jgi:hypothetical protein